MYRIVSYRKLLSSLLCSYLMKELKCRYAFETANSVQCGYAIPAYTIHVLQALSIGHYRNLS